MSEETNSEYFSEEYMVSKDAGIERRRKAHRMQRNVRRSKLKLSRLRTFLRILLIVFLIYGGYRLYNCKMWYVSSTAFNSVENKSLKIIGNKITPSYKILNQLRITNVKHEPIFMTETGEFVENIKKLPPIKNAYIRRFWWPARLVVMVEERVPILSIAPTPDVVPVAFFAQGGVLIGRDYLPLSPSFKTYLVLSYGTRGDDYHNWDEKKVAKIEKFAQTVEANSSEKIVYLDFRDPKDIYVKLQTTTLRIGELNSTVLERIKDIGAILKQVKKMDKVVKYVDLRWDGIVYIKLE